MDYLGVRPFGLEYGNTERMILGVYDPAKLVNHSCCMMRGYD